MVRLIFRLTSSNPVAQCYFSSMLVPWLTRLRCTIEVKYIMHPTLGGSALLSSLGNPCVPQPVRPRAAQAEQCVHYGQRQSRSEEHLRPGP